MPMTNETPWNIHTLKDIENAEKCATHSC